VKVIKYFAVICITAAVTRVTGNGFYPYTQWTQLEPSKNRGRENFSK